MYLTAALRQSNRGISDSKNTNSFSVITNSTLKSRHFVTLSQPLHIFHTVWGELLTLSHVFIHVSKQARTHTHTGLWNVPTFSPLIYLFILSARNFIHSLRILSIIQLFNPIYTISTHFPLFQLIHTPLAASSSKWSQQSSSVSAFQQPAFTPQLLQKLHFLVTTLKSVKWHLVLLPH